MQRPSLFFNLFSLFGTESRIEYLGIIFFSGRAVRILVTEGFPFLFILWTWNGNVEWCANAQLRTLRAIEGL